MAWTGFVYLPMEEIVSGWRVESNSSTRGDRVKPDVPDLVDVKATGLKATGMGLEIRSDVAVGAWIS